MNKRITVAIIDYDMGNIKSIKNAINHIGDFNIEVTNDGNKILSADIIILPGVGAFPDAMQKLRDRDLLNALNEAVVTNRVPTLGICLGMQLLFENSEEKGLTNGLGWIPGKVVYMEPTDDIRIPHIGWNSLILSEHNSLFDFLGHDKDFYFVHSLHAQCEDQYVLARFQYGERMIASVQYKNVVGMQFHPEKSQKNGLAALRAFFEWAKATRDLNRA
ncbi:MAG: imidazole glycerol phosphate synthase subunit HisH [Legionellales bacterium]|nr:imidazole glycerol phosphate synthase subunit HisH [Legionellales bacterium]